MYSWESVGDQKHRFLLYNLSGRYSEQFTHAYNSLSCKSFMCKNYSTRALAMTVTLFSSPPQVSLQVWSLTRVIVPSSVGLPAWRAASATRRRPLPLKSNILLTSSPVLQSSLGSPSSWLPCSSDMPSWKPWSSSWLSWWLTCQRGCWLQLLWVTAIVASSFYYVFDYTIRAGVKGSF